MPPKSYQLNELLYIEMENYKRANKTVENARISERTRRMILRRNNRIIKTIRQLLILKKLDPDNYVPHYTKLLQIK